MNPEEMEALIQALTETVGELQVRLQQQVLENAHVMARLSAVETDVARRTFRVPRTVVEPTASEVNRGRMFLNEGGSGDADTVKVVLKSAGDTYSLVTVATG